MKQMRFSRLFHNLLADNLQELMIGTRELTYVRNTLGTKVVVDKGWI